MPPGRQKVLWCWLICVSFTPGQWGWGCHGIATDSDRVALSLSHYFTFSSALVPLCWRKWALMGWWLPKMSQEAARQGTVWTFPPVHVSVLLCGIRVSFLHITWQKQWEYTALQGGFIKKKKYFLKFLGVSFISLSHRFDFIHIPSWLGPKSFFRFCNTNKIYPRRKTNVLIFLLSRMQENNEHS